MKETSVRYAVWLVRKDGTGFFALGGSESGAFASYQRRVAQQFLNELREQGMGTYKGSRVVKVRVTVETI